MVKRFKIVVFGEGAVGKTSLIERYTDATFQTDYLPTIGVQFCVKELALRDEEIAELLLWDMAGQDRFRFVRRQFFQGAVGGMAVFDITRMASLQRLDQWFNDFYANTGHDTPCILLGNKIDLINIREVPTAAAMKLCEQKNLIQYFETSALEGTEVNKAFETIGNAVLDKYRK
ncbi:MAG: Rab family GTPase [Promethearchaeota archaeon]